jgi:hypothetical protein
VVVKEVAVAGHGYLFDKLLDYFYFYFFDEKMVKTRRVEIDG